MVSAVKVYLDDERPTPDGWYRAYTVDECIRLLETKQVTHISFDNDLGEGQSEGYNCLNWLEEKVFFDPTFPVPIITIHSANAGRTHSMRQAAIKLELIRQQQVGGGINITSFLI